MPWNYVTAPTIRVMSLTDTVAKVRHVTGSVVLRFNPGGQLSPMQQLARSPPVGWGENRKAKSEKTHGLRGKTV